MHVAESDGAAPVLGGSKMRAGHPVMLLRMTENFELNWFGVELRCKDRQLDNQPVLAGTDVIVRLRQRGPVHRKRPEVVEVFEEHEHLIARVLGHRYSHLASLWLNESPHPKCFAESAPWPLAPPRPGKNARKVICSLNAARPGVERFPAILSVGSREVNTMREMNLGQVDAGVEGGAPVAFLDIRPRLILGAGQKKTLTFSAVAAIDPEVEISALISGTPEFDEYLGRYIDGYWTQDRGLRVRQLSRFFGSYRFAPSGLDVEISPSRLVIDDNRVSTIDVSYHWSRSGTALVVLKMVDTATGLTTYSDIQEIQSDEEGPIIDGDDQVQTWGPTSWSEPVARAAIGFRGRARRQG